VPSVAPAVANPFEPGASLTVPLAGFSDVHVANGVKTWVAPFARVAIALNCIVVPGAMLAGVDGVTTIEATCDVLRVVVPVMLLERAVIVVVPVLARAAVARPCDPAALLMFATVVSDEFHVVDVVMFRVLPFENIPKAVSCVVVPGAILWLDGEIEMETRLGSGPLVTANSPDPPHAWRNITSTTDAVTVIFVLHRNFFFMLPLPIRIYFVPIPYFSRNFQ
jgi:hypothetical protein